MDPTQTAPTRRWKDDLFDGALVTITAGAFCALLFRLFHN